MTTNQTIDSVPRELLDAPAVESELSRMTRRCQNAELALKVQTGNYEALKASQPQGEPVATEHYQNKINHLKQLLRNVRATLHFSPEDVLAIDAALSEDVE